MAKFRGAIVVDTEHCKGCSLCVVACPTKVIELNPVSYTHLIPHLQPTREKKRNIPVSGRQSCFSPHPDNGYTNHKFYYRSKSGSESSRFFGIYQNPTPGPVSYTHLIVLSADSSLITVDFYQKREYLDRPILHH